MRHHRLPRHARQARARDGRLHHGALRGDLDPGAAVRARWPSRGCRGAVRRTEPVRRDDRRHGLRADLHPAFRASTSNRSGSDRPRSRRTALFPPATVRPSCSEPPTTASGSGWPRRSSIAPTWPTMRGSRTNSDRCAHRDILDEAIGSWCAQHDLAEIQKIADAAGIGNSRYNLPSEVVVHPQLTARDRWRDGRHIQGGHPGIAAAAGDQQDSSSRWAPCPGLASTPTRCSANWG